VRRAFLAFTLRLSPARRAIYGIALVMAFIGLIKLFVGIVTVRIPIIPLIVSIPLPGPGWADGTLWLGGGFLVLNLLILLEVADRLTLKKDLEVAREIQQAMLPREIYAATGIEAFGVTRPANTVGGDLYDVLRRPDGRIAFALGDVAGKGSPAALLMALVVAMLRVLVDEGLEPGELTSRLNIQVSRHAPSSRFVTMVVGLYDPATGRLCYVNAGQNPPMLRRASGQFERLTEGGMALGMFDQATYAEGVLTLEAGDVLVLFSDGITEAENAAGVAFDDAGLELTINQHWWQDLSTLGTSVLRAVEAHAAGARITDDLTVLGLRRPVPLPVIPPV
jgi:sigma-B regulation protein RsbU (phosphoserine phosphatase)